MKKFQKKNLNTLFLIEISAPTDNNFFAVSTFPFLHAK